MIYIVERVREGSSQPCGWVGLCILFYSLLTDVPGFSYQESALPSALPFLQLVSPKSITVLLPDSPFLRMLHFNERIQHFNLMCTC